MVEKRVILTKHGYRRHRQRIGKMPYKQLIRRLNTAYAIGRYRTEPGMIKLQGIWWGCVSKPDGLILTTCLGRSDEVPAPERRNAHGT